MIENQPITSATRAAAVVFGAHLSARAAFLLDPDTPGQSASAVFAERCRA